MDRKKITPLHLTAIYGHARFTALLLENKANAALEDEGGRNVLELAIIHGHRAVAETVIESTTWRSAMKSSNVFVTENGDVIPDTPMRMLIRVFPDLAERVFDKCLEKKENGQIELDYEFLDDTFCLRKEGPVFASCQPDVRKPYHQNGEVVKENHCLMTMVKKRQKHLLKHPLCLGLLRHKWQTFGRYVFYVQFLLYCLFLASITTYTLLQLDRGSWPGNEKSVMDDESNLDTIFGVLVVVFACLNGLVELTQMVRMRLNYFSFGNILDWALYIFSVFFVINLPIQWEMGGCKGDTVSLVAGIVSIFDCSAGGGPSAPSWSPSPGSIF